MLIRDIKPEEITLLSEFIYEAIFQRDDTELVPRTIIQNPDVWIYIKDFGSDKDDHCLVAEVDGYIVGAVWVRCINAYGHIDENTPEFAISIYPQYRNMGIGTSLMRAMLEKLNDLGYTRTSLAVQKDNYAVRMYQSVGFNIVDDNKQEYIMVYDFTQNRKNY